MEPRVLYPAHAGMTIECLTLTQPWASLMAAEIKRFETRMWKTAYRGPLGIHAAKTIPGWVLNWYRATPIAQACLRPLGVFEAADLLRMPKGEILAVVDLLDVETTDAGPDPGATERALGDWSPGRYAWKTGGLRLVKPAFARSGAYSLWKWTVPEGVVIGEPRHGALTRAPV